MAHNDYFNEILFLCPSLGSYLGFREYDDKYENFLDKKLINSLYKINKKYIKLNEKIHTDDIKINGFLWNLKNEVLSLKTDLLMVPLSSFNNIITDSIYYNKEFYPLKTQKDVDNLLKRLPTVNDIIDSCIKTLKIGIKNKMVIPQLICKILIDDLQTYLDTKKYIIKIPINLDKKNYDDISNIFAIKLEKLIIFLKEVYMPKCQKNLGICFLPNGKKLYKQLILNNVTLDISPEEIFKYGLSEVKRIEDEYKKIRNKMGLEKLTLQEFYKNIKDNPKNYFKNKEDLLEDYEFQQKRIKDTVMKKNFYYELKNPNKIKPIPKYQETSSPAAYYYSGNYTQTRKGTFFVNTRDLKENPRYETYALSLHEGSPGHDYNFQYMIENKIAPCNIFSFSNNGFTEGWGLYAESLGEYTEIEFFGKLNFEILRAVRLVIDVGIHYYGWNFNKAFNYMKKHIPMNHETLKYELIRYISIPGQALSYKIGERMFLQLQKKFLKNDTNIKEFHKKILDNGVLPLEILKDIKFT
jgi:uncharacterized protein (DUF885 family)